MNFTTQKSVALVSYGMLILSFIMIYGIEYLPQPTWSIIGLAIYACFAFSIYRWYQSRMGMVGYLLFYTSWFFLAHILVGLYDNITAVPLESDTKMIIYVITAVLISLASVTTVLHHSRKQDLTTSDFSTKFSLADKLTIVLLLATMVFSAYLEYNESHSLAQLGAHAWLPFVIAIGIVPVIWSFVIGYKNRSGIIAFTGAWIIFYFVPLIILMFISNTALQLANHPWDTSDIRQYNDVIGPYRYGLVFVFIVWMFYWNKMRRFRIAQ